MTGRRERKKLATRRALSEAAMLLFLERGFDDVTVREIADVADVSTTTLMKHFPQKEALVFDREDEIERELVAAVRGQPDPLEALRQYLHGVIARDVTGERLPAFMQLVLSTPALAGYWRTMWLRHAEALAGALRDELDKPEAWCLAMAHFVLEAFVLASRSKRVLHTLDVAFEILSSGTGPMPASRPAARR